MRYFLLLLLSITPLFCLGQIVVKDDQGNSVVLDKPAGRIVSLAPSITELLYAAGAGDKVVGVVDYSDYPEAARKIARVGGSQALDIERIASLHPDLVVAWKSGNSSGQIAQLKKIGTPIYYAEPRRLSDIPVDIERLGVLAGSSVAAMRSAAQFNQKMSLLRSHYSGKALVSVFYEIWPAPLMTVNNDHIISDVLHLCGAKNVFGNLPVLTPTLSLEAVLEANPEAVIASGMGNARPAWLDVWRAWGGLAASKLNALYFIPADLINRQSPRILLGAEILCKQIDEVRNKR